MLACFIREEKNEWPAQLTARSELVASADSVARVTSKVAFDQALTVSPLSLFLISIVCARACTRRGQRAQRACDDAYFKLCSDCASKPSLTVIYSRLVTDLLLHLRAHA